MAVVTKNSELKILEYLKTIEDEHQNHYAIHFHLSKLLERNKSDFQIKIALNIVSDFFRKNHGEFFLLKNMDFLVVFESRSKDLVEKIIYQLRYLFIDDPLAFKAHNVKNPNFSTVYVLMFQWNEFFLMCHGSLEQQQKEIYDQPKSNNIKNNTSTYSAAPSNDFSKIDSDIKNVNFKPLLRKQNISVIVKDQQLKSIFSEIYVNLSNLKGVLKYETNFLDSKLLFKYFENKVDNVILELIKSDVTRYINGPTNLNLNVDTILSEDFIEFHKLLRSQTNASIVIDIDFSDVFMDLNSFYYANDLLKELGYKTCLDGVDSNSFCYINRESLGVDLVKFRWDPDASGHIEKSIIKDYIQKCNPHRVILTHCDDKEAIDYGKELGIFLYQGWWLEKSQNYNVNKITNF